MMLGELVVIPLPGGLPEASRCRGGEFTENRDRESLNLCKHIHHLHRKAQGIPDRLGWQCFNRIIQAARCDGGH